MNPRDILCVAIERIDGNADVAQLVAPTQGRGPDRSVRKHKYTMAWVYILKTRSGKFYVGSTENLETRLQHHLRGATPSTKRLHAESFLLKQEYLTIQDARSVERKIERLKRRDYIEEMIKDGYIRLKPR